MKRIAVAVALVLLFAACSASPPSVNDRMQLDLAACHHAGYRVCRIVVTEGHEEVTGTR